MIDLAQHQNKPTPFYHYDLGLLRRSLDRVSKAANQYNYHIHYALKANSNHKILELIKEFGLGADCVSGPEVQRALDCGYAPDKIVFAGVGKSDEEILLGLKERILCFNCESIQEILVINNLAKEMSLKADIALRINPNVHANTHKYITTGLEENKFGINLWELDELMNQLAKLDNVEVKGLHFHIGSQITDLTAFQGLCLRVNEIQNLFEQRKQDLDHINLGGGLGIDYYDPDTNEIVDFEGFFKIFDDLLELRPNQKVHFELGRSIVGQCGNLISRVLYVKEGVQKKFAILDAGMTELIRPALYQAYHKIEKLGDLSEPYYDYDYDVVGPICESSDCFGKSIRLPELKRGDLIAIRSCGAYGEVMASQYNLRRLPPAYYTD